MDCIALYQSETPFNTRKHPLTLENTLYYSKTPFNTRKRTLTLENTLQHSNTRFGTQIPAVHPSTGLLDRRTCTTRGESVTQANKQKRGRIDNAKPLSHSPGAWQLGPNSDACSNFCILGTAPRAKCHVRKAGTPGF